MKRKGHGEVNSFSSRKYSHVLTKVKKRDKQQKQRREQHKYSNERRGRRNDCGECLFNLSPPPRANSGKTAKHASSA